MSKKAEINVADLNFSEHYKKCGPLSNLIGFGLCSPF